MAVVRILVRRRNEKKTNLYLRCSNCIIGREWVYLVVDKNEIPNLSIFQIRILKDVKTGKYAGPRQSLDYIKERRGKRDIGNWGGEYAGAEFMEMRWRWRWG